MLFAQDLDSLHFQIEFDYFQTLADTYRPDYNKYENYTEIVNRLKKNIKEITTKNANRKNNYLKIFLGEYYRFGWNLNIEGFDKIAFGALTDTIGMNERELCRMKFALAKFYLNCNLSYNQSGQDILQSIKSICGDEFPDIYWWLSYGFTSIGNKKMAITYLEEYLGYVPKDSASIKLLERLKKPETKLKNVGN
jgi:hypothetical protein